MKMTYHKKQSILNQYDPGKVKEGETMAYSEVNQKF